MISIEISGLKKLEKKFKESSDVFRREMNVALGKAIAMVETESKRLTPIDTGLLRSSIGGELGYSFVRGLTAGVGTNVKYAYFVHEGYARHKIGERKFMEKGAEAAQEFIKGEVAAALERLAKQLV